MGRILLESDAPDALPKSDLDSLFWVEKDSSASEELQTKDVNSASSSGNLSDNPAVGSKSVLPQETLNHPANIHSVSLWLSPFFFHLFLLYFSLCYCPRQSIIQPYLAKHGIFHLLHTQS